MQYEPTWESVRQHPVPDWFHDAKLGIIIHSGLYSVPAWAVTGHSPKQRLRESGWREHFAYNTYAEWYLNSLRISYYELIVEAGLTGDRKVALEALLLDPLTSVALTLPETKRLLDEMMAAEVSFLPQFA